MKASSLSFMTAVLLGLAGMIWGIIMAASGDHSAMPAHAHLNLLGWVSLFLFGIFYHIHPAVDGSRLALVQVAVWVVATLLLTTGVGLINTGHMAGEPIAAVSSLFVVADMLLFGWIVLKRDITRPGAPHRVMPAE